MRATLAILTTALLTGCATMPDQHPRYVIEKHEVTPHGAEKPIAMMIKLDSASGDIWRYTGKEFIAIPSDRAPTASEERETEEDLEKQRAREATIAKMKEIVVPEMEFRSAHINDVIEYLADVSRKHDPKKEGVDIILNLRLPQHALEDPDPSVDEADPFAAVDPQEPDDDSIPLITFKARYISISEALEIVTSLACLHYRIKGNVVMVTPHIGHTGELLHRVYQLRPATLKNFQSNEPQLFDKDLSSDEIQENWKTYFEDFGVCWPRGSMISPAPIVGNLFVRNSPQNLVLFERILAVLDAYPPRNGRFQLIPPTPMSDLMLLDTDDGDTWEYRITQMSQDGATVAEDKFLHIPTRE